MPALGLPISTSTMEAEAALTVWQRIDVVQNELAAAKRRRVQLEDDITTYKNEVSALISDLGEAVTDLDLTQDPPQVVTVLSHRQRDMSQLSARLKDAQENVRRAERAVQTAEGAAQNALRDQLHLREQHNLPEDADVAALTKQSAERRRLDALLAHERASLAAQSDGYDEAFLRAEVSTMDADEAAAEVDRLDNEIEQLRNDWQNAAQIVTALGKDLSAMSVRAGVGEAAQRANEAAADMLEFAERWLRLRAASIILSKAVERYRRANQHPLIKRASEIFATMTATGENPIVRLAVNYTDEVHPVLEGIRKEGKPCPVSGMSAGTLDQLFLALRIAVIEQYIQTSGAIPFIADDLFITSDDERTVPGIVALAELGKKTQVLLFTHHRYVVDSATKVLRPEELKVHSLRRPH